MILLRKARKIEAADAFIATTTRQRFMSDDVDTAACLRAWHAGALASRRCYAELRYTPLPDAAADVAAPRA